MFRDSLASRFQYEGRIGGFNRFAVFAAYFDESGQGKTNRTAVAVAGAMATADNWLLFERRWAYVLEHAKLVEGFKGFHAREGGHTQRVLNYLLAYVMRECNVQSMCITLDTVEYLAVTTPTERSQLGNEYGFASFACVSLTADRFKQEAPDARGGFYVEQGGPGSAKTMQLLREIYVDDDWRERMGMATFGPADRRIDTPVHAADLVAHEVQTDRHHSEPLKVLGDLVSVVEVSPDKLREVLDEYAGLLSRVKREKSRRRLARRLGRKRE